MPLDAMSALGIDPGDVQTAPGAAAPQQTGQMPTLTVTGKRSGGVDPLAALGIDPGDIQAHPPPEQAGHSSLGDIGQQLWGGLKRGVVGMANVPTTLLNAQGDLIRSTVNAGAGRQIVPEGQLAGLPEPQVPEAKDFAGRAAERIGEFAPGMALGATEGLPGIARQILPTIGGAIGSQAAEEVAPESLKPAAAMAGGLLSGGAAAGAQEAIGQGIGGAWRAAGRMGLTPKQDIGGISATNAQAQAAGKQISQAVGPEGAERLNDPGQSLQFVPGSQPTTAQVAQTPGAAALEKAHRVATPDPFIARAQEQNNARVGSIQRLAPEGQVGAVGDYFRQRLAELDQEGQQAATAGQGAVQQATGALGGEQPAAAYGDQARAALQGAKEPVHAATRALWDAVDPDGTWALPVGGMRDAAQSLIRETSPTAQTDAQEQGLLQRAAGLPDVAKFQDLGQMRADINAAMRRLSGTPGYDPNIRRLTMLKGSLDQSIADAAEGRAGQEAQAVESGQMPQEQTMMAGLAKDQAQWYAARNRNAQAVSAGGNNGPGPWQMPGGGPAAAPGSFRAGSQAPRGSGGPPGSQGVSPQAQSGSLGPSAQPPTDWMQQNAASAIDFAGKLGLTRQIGELAAAGRTAKEISEAIGGKLDAGEIRAVRDSLGIKPSGPSGFAFGPAIPTGGLAAAPAAQRLTRPQSLTDFLISRGGIQDQGGDLAAIGADAIHHRQGGRLVNPRGQSLDYAREAAEEEGFLRPGSSIPDLLNAVAEEASGRPQYRLSDQAVGEAWAQSRRESNLQDEAYRNAREAISVAESDAGQRLSSDEIEHATQLAMRGIHPEEALRQAARAGEEVKLDRNARLTAFGSPGVPPGATQTELPGGRPQLRTNFGQEPAQRYQAAVAATRAEKQRFGQGAVGQVLRPGKQGEDWAVQAGNVPGKIFTGGPTEPAEVERFINAVGGPQQASDIGRNVLANELRQGGIIRPDGSINSGRFQTWLAKRGPTIDQFPGLRDQFANAQRAQDTLDTVTATHAQALRDFDRSAAARFINDDPQVAVGKAFGSGNSQETFRTLVRQVRGNPDAENGLKRAVADYIIEKTRGATPSGATEDFLKADTFRKFVRTHSGALKELFGGQGVQNLDMVAADLRRQAQMTKATAGSDTAANIAAAKKVGLKESAFHGTALAVIGEQLGSLLEHATGHGGMLGEAAGAALGGGGYLIHALRQRGIGTVNDLVREAMLHPQLARELMARAPAGQVSRAAMRRIGAALQGTVAGNVIDQQRQ